MTGNRPEDTIRDGNLKATIWRNESERGPFFSTTITKSYRDEQGEYRDTQSLTSDDLLRVSELARSAHHRVNELRREHSRAPDRDSSRDAGSTAERDFKRNADDARTRRRPR